MNRVGRVLSAAPRRAHQQHARPARGGQLHLRADAAHRRTVAREAVEPIKPADLAAVSLQQLPQPDGFIRNRVGRREKRRRGQIFAADNRDDADHFLRRGPQGNESRRAKDAPPGRVRATDAGRNLLPLQNRRRRTQPRGNGVLAGNLRAGMIQASPPEQIFARRAEPVEAGLIAKHDRALVVQEIDRPIGPVQHLHQFCGVASPLGHSGILKESGGKV